MGESVRSSRVISTEDTSLVLPSDKNQCTGQQRVLQQVHSIKRSKTKIIKNGSLLSPTSPPSTSEYSEPKFQFSPTKQSISLYRMSSSKTRRQSRMNGHSLTVCRRQPDNSLWESQISISNSVKPDESIMNGSFHLMTQKNNLSRAATMKTASPSQVVTKVRSKSDLSGMNGAIEAMSAMTIKEAVEFLSHSDIQDQQFGASIIQHHTFNEEKAKQEVCDLGGIHSLILLLKSENSQLQQTAAAALRNVVFKHSESKNQVKQYGGLNAIVALLQSNSITETQKQLTGLLWNLSSADNLKSDLNKIGLVPLTENIIVPYTLGYDNTTDKLIDPEVFCNTTGCIRNLSSSNEEERIRMRNCSGLIESLMKYVQSQMHIGETDDKSVENCVCILHNLSYQLDKEASEHFSITDEDTTKTQKAKNEDKSNNSIFSSKSTKTQQLSFPAMDVSKPEGVGWLYNTKSLQLYISLLNYSRNNDILEATCGALQNLTASKNSVSTVISQTIAEKLKGLLVISPLLNSKKLSLQKTAMSLVGNMSRVSNLRATMAKEALPHVSSFLSSVTPNMNESDAAVTTACRVMQTIMVAEPEHSKKVLNRDLIENVSLLSENMSFPTARHAAGVLLYCLWKEKDIQNTLKKVLTCTHPALEVVKRNPGRRVLSFSHLMLKGRGGAAVFLTVSS